MHTEHKNRKIAYINQQHTPKKSLASTRINFFLIPTPKAVKLTPSRKVREKVNSDYVSHTVKKEQIINIRVAEKKSGPEIDQDYNQVF